MLHNFLMQWILSVTFGVTGGYAVLALVRTHSLRLLVSYMLHACMSFVMVAMCWDWWFGIPAIPQIIFFSGATLWYFFQLVLSRKSAASQTALTDSNRRWPLLAHFTMTATMLWMAIAMSPHTGHNTHGTSHEALPIYHIVLGIVFTALLIGFGSMFAVHFFVTETAPSRKISLKYLMETLMFAGMGSMTWLMLSH